MVTEHLQAPAALTPGGKDNDSHGLETWMGRKGGSRPSGEEQNILLHQEIF
jgi:hypothetical protein